MLPCQRDYPYSRPNGIIPLGVLPVNTMRNSPTHMSRPFSPPLMQGRPYAMHHLHGGISGYPPPPPTPVPRPHPCQFIPSQQAFVPSIQFTPLADALPQPPAATSLPPPFGDIKPDGDDFNPVLDVATSLPCARKPADPEILQNIKDMVEFVARNGPRYEIIARARHAGDPKFAFLFENDSDPEAVFNREFYKQKKQSLQSQLQAEADNKSHNDANHKLEMRWNEVTRKGEQPPGSPGVSDMDMEDDLISPIPKRESSNFVTDATSGSASENNPRDELSEMRFLSQEKVSRFADFPQVQEDGDRKESQGKTHALDMDMQAECRLSGSFSGRLMGSYHGDTAYASDNSELSQNVDVDVDGRSNQKGKGVSEPKLNVRDGHGAECLESLGFKEMNDSRANEQQRDFQGERPPKKEASDQSMRRGRSKSRSGYSSRSKASSSSRSSSSGTVRKERKRSRSRSRNRRQPMEDFVSVKSELSLSSSDTAASNRLHRSSSVALPQHFHDRVKKRVKQNGHNPCINHVRGRCFRGELCRLYHQVSPDNRSCGSDTTHELAIRRAETHTEVRDSTQSKFLETSEVLELATVSHHSEGKMVCEAEETLEPTMKSGPHFEKLEADSKFKKQGWNSTVILPLEDKSAIVTSPTVVGDFVQTSGIGATDVSTSASIFHTRNSGSQLFQSSSSVEFNSQRLHLENSSMGKMVSSQLTPSESGSYFHQSMSFRPVEYPCNLTPFNQQTPLAPLSNHYMNRGKDGDHHNLKISECSENQIQCHSGGLTTRNVLKPYSFHGHDSQGFIQTNHEAKTSMYESSNASMNDPPQTEVFTIPSSQHGFSPAFPILPRSPQGSDVSCFTKNFSREFTFSNATNHAQDDGYPKSCYTQSEEHTTSRLLPMSAEVLSGPAIGPSSSYSYTLTTIPPLSNLIKFAGENTESLPPDELLDGFKHCSSDCSKSTPHSFIAMTDEGKFVSGWENVSPEPEIPDAGKDEIGGEGDPFVGIVENASPPEDNNWNLSPGGSAEGAEDGQSIRLSETNMNNKHGMKLLRSAVAGYVKEVLKPTWRKGRMSKDIFKTIVKKAVDKVIVALPSHRIPKTPGKVDQFMMSSRSKISKLVQGYIDKYQQA